MRSKAIGLATMVAMGLVFIVTPAAAQPPRKLVIFNATHSPVAAFQVRPTGTPKWQENLLNQQTLGVARTANVSLSTNPCFYDFFISFDDGRRLIKPRVNICTIAAYTVPEN